jgi:hypothetical protein
MRRAVHTVFPLWRNTVHMGTAWPTSVIRFHTGSLNISAPCARPAEKAYTQTLPEKICLVSFGPQVPNGSSPPNMVYMFFGKLRLL